MEVTRWHPREPAAHPSGRVSAMMAFHEAAVMTLLFGGHRNLVPRNDAWEWDGQSWREITPRKIIQGMYPSARHTASMTYDESRRQIVMFGGITEAGQNAETWLFDGNDWHQQFPSKSPGPRSGSAMAYDAQRGTCILSGGYFGTPLNDTWEWDGENWHIVKTVNPPARSEAAIAPYIDQGDASRSHLVMFGGFGENARLSDTWIFANGEWNDASVEGPEARYRHAMAYAVVRGQTIMFGGDNNRHLKDTWAWNGEEWADLSSVDSPGARDRLSMSSDYRRREIILFGGEGTAIFDDTWAWALT